MGDRAPVPEERLKIQWKKWWPAPRRKEVKKIESVEDVKNCPISKRGEEREKKRKQKGRGRSDLTNEYLTPPGRDIIFCQEPGNHRSGGWRGCSGVGGRGGRKERRGFLGLLVVSNTTAGRSRCPSSLQTARGTHQPGAYLRRGLYASSYRYPLRKSPDVVGTTGDPASAKKSIRRAWRLMAGFTCPDAAAGFVHEGPDTPSTRPFPANEDRRSHALEFSDTWLLSESEPEPSEGTCDLEMFPGRVPACAHTFKKSQPPFSFVSDTFLGVCVRGGRKAPSARKDKTSQGLSAVSDKGTEQEKNWPDF